MKLDNFESLRGLGGGWGRGRDQAEPGPVSLLKQGAVATWIQDLGLPLHGPYHGEASVGPVDPLRQSRL